MINTRRIAIAVLAAFLAACPGKTKTVVTPILPGDGSDNTAKPTDPVGPKKATDPWAKADLIEGPTPKAPTKLELPPVERFTLKNGLQVVVVASKQLPLVSMQLAIKSGRADEPQGKLGVSAFTAQMLTLGTQNGKKKKSALDIAKAIDFVGGGLESNASYEATLVSCSTLKKDVGKHTPRGESFFEGVKRFFSSEPT